jgi:hypothetical protein
MSKYFPETYAVLGWYGLENVKFWPIGVELETRLTETNNINPETNTPYMEQKPFLHPLKPARGWKIKVDHSHDSTKPVFTEKPFYEFIDWLKETVMA